METSKGRSIVLIIIAIILLIALAAGIILYFNFYDINKLNPSLKAILSKVPILNKKIIQQDASADANKEEEKQQILQEKEKIKEEWAAIEKQKLELQNKEAELKQKEAELEAKEQEIQVNKEKLETQIANVKNLAQYYELMDASSAAKILQNVEDEFLIQLFQNMKKDAVAEILSNLDPKKAASVTKKMSGLQ